MFSDIIFACFQLSRCWITAYIGSMFTGSLVTFSWFFHKINKRYMFTCYKSSCSDNVLTQSCLLILVSHLVVRYSQHSHSVESSMIKYYSFRGSSISPIANSVILIRAISETFLLDRNSSAFTLIFGSSVDGAISQDIFMGHRCCTTRSK